ncbi:hypothetical protein [Metabacillus indicus]|uniref:hypothetical protein n=1 Tax=Metabacillus indicus TaxID=246786 RepID=UPI000492F073|nr:hypothetical protein [Metabacillus indicus]KEZ47748.1 hypothetical protein AZ46_0220365 [Metabacillus indicus LMG 22858]
MNYILKTSELNNAIDYLEKAAFYFNKRDNDYWFKWLVISLYGALYGFGVCAIKGINTETVLEKKIGTKKFNQKKKETIEFYKSMGFDIELDSKLLDSTVEYNLSPLLSIRAILDHCQNESFMDQKLNSKVLNVSEQQKVAIDKLILYRNEFAHFKPRLVFVISEGEEVIIKEIVDIIKFLCLESGNINFFDDGNLEKVKYLISQFHFNK